MAATSTEPAATAAPLPLLTPHGRHDTRATEEIAGADGRPLAAVSLAPDLLISQALTAQKRTPPLRAEDRSRRLADAAERFLDDNLGGLSFTEHLRLVSDASGHGQRTTAAASRAVAAAIAEAPRRADRGRPVGSVQSWQDALAGHGGGVWTRRGDTLAAVLSGNSPTIQNGWLQALALGYRVAVRPSRREPFTAFRVIEALRAAGFRDVDVVYLPTTHEGVQTLLRRADLGLLYGGDAVTTTYATSATVKAFGPGRTKTLLTGGHYSDAAVESVADAVSSLSGAGCVNTTGVFVEGDHADFARRLAAALTARAHEYLRAGDHLGPRVSENTAESFLHNLDVRLRTAHAQIPLSAVATAHPDGGVILGPAVFVVDSPHHDALSAELPFPCAWVAPWRTSDGAAPLADSLIVNAVTQDAELIETLLHDPSVRNVYLDIPTVHSDGDLPHEDFVGNFLMRNKAVAAP